MKLARLCPYAASLAAALALGGCFHPLYGTVANGGAGIQSELEAIVVDPIPDRIGHYLGNDLIFALNGTGDPITPKYHLLVTTSQGTSAAIIDTLAATATSATLTTNANYRLIPAGGGGEITSGTVTSTASYDRFQDRYTNIRAARNAEIRNAEVLADLIKTRLAAALVPKT
jgi:LPS-assembly lipoprotein